MKFNVFVFLLVIFAWFSYLAKAQMPQADRPPIGIIRGKVIDATTQQAIEYATIALMPLRDTTKLTGALTDEKGAFTMEDVFPGKYILKVNFIGYLPYRSDTLRINPKNPMVNLPAIKLKPNTKMLEDIVVEGEREQMLLQIDKKVFEVDKNPVVEGGSAADALKQIPSVSVDTDGNVSVRGTTNVQIWVNGKQFANAGSAQQILDQIPASNIERVELITNPSARYDAESMGGIINIVLKKNRADGVNGSFASGFGTRDAYNESVNKYNAINKYNGTFTLNIKKGKWNFSTNYGYRYGQRWQAHRTFRQNKIDTNFTNGFQDFDTANYQIQRSAAELFSHNHLLNIGAEYELDKNNTFELRVATGYNENNEPERLTYDFRNNAFQLYEQRIRDISNREYAYNYNINTGYRRLFSIPGKELNISGSYSWANNYRFTRFFQQIPPQFGSFLPEDAKVLPFNINNVYVAQIDYMQPVSEKSKIEIGAKTTIREFDNDFIYQNYLYATQSYVNDLGRTNRFVYNDYVHAAYGIYNQQFGNGFSAQAGLRFEHTTRVIKQVTSNENFSDQFLDPFPTLHISKKMPHNQEWRISYSRRTNRPNPGVLNPFPTYNDPLNLVKGNPFLKPEYVHIADISYNRTWDKHNFVATGFFRQINGSSQRVRTLVPTRDTSITIFTNIGYNRQVGLELISKNEFFKWWSITSNINLFYVQVFGQGGRNQEYNLNRENLSGNARLISNFKVWKGVDLQVTGYYMLPIAIAQGTFFGMNGIDLGFRKDIIPKKAFITANISDVFNTRQFNANQEAFSFYSEIRRKRETRVLTVNFTYRFGNESLMAKNNRTRKGRTNGEGEGGGMDF